jgi:hypothetical protein
MRYLALALSFLMVFSGCSTFWYSGRPVPVPKIEAMPVWRTEGPVTVGVDPYLQPDRQRKVFGENLEEEMLPIYVLVKNNGERPLSLRHADIKLEFTRRKSVHPRSIRNSPPHARKMAKSSHKSPGISGSDSVFSSGAFSHRVERGTENRLPE